MKKNILIFILCTLSLFAEEEKPKGYVYYDFSMLTFTNTGTNKDFIVNGAMWTLGYTLKEAEFTIPYLEVDVKFNSALEFNYISNTKSDTKSDVISTFSDVNYGDMTARLDKLYAVHAKLPLSIGDKLDINLFLGASYSGVILNNENFNITDHYNTGLSYGMGVEYMLPKNISLHVSYMQYFENLSAFNLGFGLKF